MSSDRVLQSGARFTPSCSTRGFMAPLVFIKASEQVQLSTLVFLLSPFCLWGRDCLQVQARVEALSSIYERFPEIRLTWLQSWGKCNYCYFFSVYDLIFSQDNPHACWSVLSDIFSATKCRHEWHWFQFGILYRRFLFSLISQLAWTSYLPYRSRSWTEPVLSAGSCQIYLCSASESSMLWSRVRLPVQY